MANTGMYEIECEFSSHEALQAGITALPRHPGGPTFSTIFLSADAASSDAEACALAAQMAACTSGGMPTRTRLISFPI